MAYMKSSLEFRTREFMFPAYMQELRYQAFKQGREKDFRYKACVAFSSQARSLSLSSNGETVFRTRRW